MVVSVSALLGALGVLLNQVFIWPQVRRAARTVQGISVLTVLTGLLARLLWVVYGATLGDVPLVVGNVTVSVGFLVLLLLLVRRAERRLVLVAGGASVVLAVVAVSLAGGAVLGWTAVVTGAVVAVPQMVRALADRDRLAGVSVPTYMLMVATSTCWLCYGLLIGEYMICAAHAILLPTSLVVALAAMRSHVVSARALAEA